MGKKRTPDQSLVSVPFLDAQTHTHPRQRYPDRTLGPAPCSRDSQPSTMGAVGLWGGEDAFVVPNLQGCSIRRQETISCIAHITIPVPLLLWLGERSSR